MSPEDSGEVGRYCEFRQWGEDPECSALRLRLVGADVGEYEKAYQEARKAAGTWWTGWSPDLAAVPCPGCPACVPEAGAA